MKNSLRTYGKYPIRRVNGIRQFDKNGNPVLDDKVKTDRLEPSTVKILNKNAEQFGYVYIEEVEETPEVEETKEEEAPKVNELDELRAKAKALKIKGAHNMGKEKLVEKIKEAESK